MCFYATAKLFFKQTVILTLSYSNYPILENIEKKIYFLSLQTFLCNNNNNIDINNMDTCTFQILWDIFLLFA